MCFLSNVILKYKNQICLRKSKENTNIVFAKYLSTHMNKPTIALTYFFYYQNSQVSKNLAIVFFARKGSKTIINDKFHFSD